MKKKTLTILLTIIGIITIIVIGIFEFKKYQTINTTNQELVSAEKQGNFLTEITNRHKFFVSLEKPSQVAYQKYHVLPSISIAQAIVESNWGKSELSSKYHNLYGIKDTKGVKLDTKEVIDGKTVVIKGKFAIYDNNNESVIKHAQLLARGTSDKHNRYQQVIDAKNYNQAASALQKAGYATDTNYADKLIQVIEMYQLDKLDK